MSEEVFPNQLSEQLPYELALADQHGIVATLVQSPNFETIINMGTVKWIVTTENELLIISHTVDGIEFAHSVINHGSPVKAAGEADIAGIGGQFFGLAINNHSGHYQPNAASLDIALGLFESFGIIFDEDSIERID